MKRFTLIALAFTLFGLAAAMPRTADAAEVKAPVHGTTSTFWCPWWMPLCALT